MTFISPQIKAELPILLDAKDISRNFGGLQAVVNMNMVLRKGELISIIGPNGAGKTTFFNLLTGLDQADGGEILFDEEDIRASTPEKIAKMGIARTFQHGRVFANLSILENVMIGAHTRLRAVKPNIPVFAPFAELGLAIWRTKAVQREEEELREQALDILSIFGERLLPRLNDRAYSLSYANRRRLEIARALALKPRLLLLDEPTAGMNQTETTEMLEIIQHLKQSGLSILLIEHKLDLVMQLSDRIIVMDDGRKISEGTPDIVRNDPAVINAYMGQGIETRQRHENQLSGAEL